MPICKTFLSYTLLYKNIDPNVNEKPVRKKILEFIIPTVRIYIIMIIYYYLIEY